MLLDNEELIKRLDSPLNLLNRLREASSSKTQVISLPSSKELIPDLDEKISKTSVGRVAGEVLRKSLNKLNTCVDEIDRPERLARVARDMGVVIDSLKEKANDPDGLKVQVIVYRPEILTENHYETIRVNE